MAEVISVKFKGNGRAYFFNPDGKKVSDGDLVIVDTANGIELGTVSEANHPVDNEKIANPLKKMVRIAEDRDIKRAEENKKKADDALKLCETAVIDHKLDMKLVEAEYSFDGSKIIFFFTSDGRVDFRELVKDLASKLHTRIELRQIGVRDEAKMLGGIGICGQPYCCKRFLDDFQPVSIKMAKEQGLSLNPTKISGSCGRLMCCLKYEQDAYEYLNAHTPGIGATVKTREGSGTVIDSNLISGILCVRLTDSDAMPVKVHRDEVEFVSRPKRRPKPNEHKAKDK